MSKKVFAPPVAKSSRTPFGKGESELRGKAEDGVAVKSLNTSPVQSKKQKGSPSDIEKEPERKKNLEMVENEKGCLSDAQFEEIVQSVLQKSPQECGEKPQERLDPARSGQRSRRETSSEAFLPAEGSDSEAGRKEHQIRVKKRLNQDERAAANNVGCKESRKGKPEKAAQGDAQDVTGPEEAPEEEEEEEGGGSGRGRSCTAWVQCSSPGCEKWRRLSSDVDPSALPEDWSCRQNPDLRHNSCSVPEEAWSGSEDEVVYAIYFPGSIVWAKQYGYPWWPGIIEADPDLGEYFLFSSQADALPSKYHVTFFGHSATRAWISASLLKNYGEPPGEGNASAKLRSKSEKEDLRAALEMAREAERTSIQERTRRFGFHSRFKHKEAPREDYKTLKELNNAASRPRVRGAGGGPQGGQKKKKTKKTVTAPSSRNPGELLRQISGGGKPHAKLKKAIDKRGDQKPQLGGLENEPPAVKKRRPERRAPKGAGSGRATGTQDSSQKGFQKPSSCLPPPGEASQARHPLGSPAHVTCSPQPGRKDRSDRSGGSPGLRET